MSQESCTGEVSILEYIEDYREMNISFDRMHLKEVITFYPDSAGVTDGLILGEVITDKYKHDLKNMIDTKTFTKDEIHKYKCNPWALSYDLYGTVEFWQLLLDLNDMYSATEFTKKTVKVYDQTLPDVIDAIFMSEEKALNYNDDIINEALGIQVTSTNDDE